MKKIVLLCLICMSESLLANSLDLIKEKVAELQSSGYSNEQIFASEEIAQLLGAIKNFAKMKEAQNYLKQFASTHIRNIVKKITQKNQT